jgi:hypothetical protein
MNYCVCAVCFDVGAANCVYITAVCACYKCCCAYGCVSCCVLLFELLLRYPVYSAVCDAVNAALCFVLCVAVRISRYNPCANLCATALVPLL